MLFGETTVGTGYFLFDKFRVLFSESLRCDFGCTRARLVPADLLALNRRRRPHGAFHCTPGTEAIGTDRFWRASLYAGDPAARGEFSSTVDDPMGRFTVRWRRRPSGRTASGALHCTPETPTRGGEISSAVVPMSRFTVR